MFHIKYEIVSGDKTGYKVFNRVSNDFVENKKGEVSEIKTSEKIVRITLMSHIIETIERLKAADEWSIIGNDAVNGIIDKIVWRELDNARLTNSLCCELGGQMAGSQVCRWCKEACSHAGKRQQVIVASRHEATINYLRQWFADRNVDTVVMPSVSKEDVTGKIVAGNLPVNLAAYCKQYIAVCLPEDCPRGQELDAEYIRKNIRLQAYTIGFLAEAYQIF